jgi:Ser/Thr protein kinase RdoA (MazF antagonist)
MWRVLPRHVVTVVRRRAWTQRQSAKQIALMSRLADRRRPDPHPHNAGRQLEFSFPNTTVPRDAKVVIVRLLSDLEPKWKRYFVVYPRDQNL